MQLWIAQLPCVSPGCTRAESNIDGFCAAAHMVRVGNMHMIDLLLQKLASHRRGSLRMHILADLQQIHRVAYHFAHSIRQRSHNLKLIICISTAQSTQSVIEQKHKSSWHHLPGTDRVLFVCT